MDEKVTLQGGDDYNSSPIRINLEGLDIRHTHEGNYEPLKLDISGSSIVCGLDISKPKIEVLTDLLGKLLQFRESDLAKLTLIDREKEITQIIDDVLNKIQSELISY